MRWTSTYRKTAKMAKVRYVILVPVEITDEVFGDDDFMTEWGRQHAERYSIVESAHPRQEAPYTAKLIEAVRIEGAAEDPIVDMDDMIAPGVA